jgi:diaminopimelate epimerase
VTALAFVKASACGNDFLIIEGSSLPGEQADLAALTRKICDRHQGVGGDGVEWLFPASDAEVQARLLNADGSEAEISGNGTRCVAAYLCHQQNNNKEKVVIRTGAGLKTCTLTSRQEVRYEFETAMGAPQVGRELSINLVHGTVRGIPVSMGNPHYSVFVAGFPADWPAQAAEIQDSGCFKHGINVEMVVIKDGHNIEVRFFERGVGETRSSGTGSCASAVAAISTGRAESPVEVHAAGGVQAVRWEGEVYLRGPAQLICRGEFFA